MAKSYFSHTTAPNQKELFLPKGASAGSHFRSSGAAVTGTHTVGHRPQGCRPFWVSPVSQLLLLAADLPAPLPSDQPQYRTYAILLSIDKICTMYKKIKESRTGFIHVLCYNPSLSRFSKSMTFLRTLFGPSKEEIWRQICRGNRRQGCAWWFLGRRKDRSHARPLDRSAGHLYRLHRESRCKLCTDASPLRHSGRVSLYGLSLGVFQ